MLLERFALTISLQNSPCLALRHAGLSYAPLVLVNPRPFLSFYVILPQAAHRYGTALLKWTEVTEVVIKLQWWRD